MQAARDISAQSNYFSSLDDDREPGDSSEDDSDEEYERSVVGGIPMALRYAVMAFNVKCEDDGDRFQWFDETIEGPLEVLEVQAPHKRGCDLCDSRPTFGEVYFRCVWVDLPTGMSLLCSSA